MTEQLTQPVSLRAALEAVLFVVDEPVAEVVLAQVLERPQAEVAVLLGELAESYRDENRGIELRSVGESWRIYTRSECAEFVERFVRDGRRSRLSQAALETLAVVAYRQPTSRARVAAVRGVNVDAVMRTLLTRGLVTETGVERESGAVLYGTTEHFLERIGMASLDELPPLSEHLPDSSVLEDDDVHLD
jgi:segregation and condensation protein B